MKKYKPVLCLIITLVIVLLFPVTAAGGVPAYIGYTEGIEQIPDSEEEPTPLLGDANMDSLLSVEDARVILQQLVGKDTLPLQDIADVDGNGEIEIADARLILQKLVGKIENFPRTTNPDYKWVPVPDISAETAEFDYFIEWIGIDSLLYFNKQFQKNNTVKLIGFGHPGWSLYDKEISTPLVNTLYEFRSQLNPMEYDSDIYGQQYPDIRQIIRYEDGWYLVFLYDGYGVMGRSLYQLDRYFRYDEAFASYAEKLFRAYPYKYYTGDWRDGVVEYTLYYDAPDEIEVTLVSIEHEKGVLTFTLDAEFDGEIEKILNIRADSGTDVIYGSIFEIVTISGNTRIEAVLDLSYMYSENLDYMAFGFPITVRLRNTIFQLETYYEPPIFM